MISAILDTFIPSRKSAKDLSYENRRLEMFLRSIPWEYCGWNAKGTQAVSAGFSEMTGVDKIETVLDIQEALSADDAKELDGMYAHLSEYGNPFQMDVVWKKDKKKTYRLYGKRGQIPGMQPDEVFDVIWMQDISRDAEHRLDISLLLKETEDKEEKWRSILNTLPFPIWLRGAGLDIEWCNKSYMQILGEKRSVILDKQHELPTTSLKGKAVKGDKGSRNLAREALGTGKTQAEKRHLIIEGKRHLVNIEEIPIAQDDKTIIVGCAHDVTALEDLQAELKHHVTSHHDVLEQLRTAIAVFDGDTHLEFYNAAYEQLWGMDGKWLNSRPKITEILDKHRESRKLPEQADFKKYRQNWLNMFTSLLEPYEEMQYLPDGTALRMIVVPRPMGGVIITYEDVTSRLELETSYNTLVAVQKETLDNLNEGLAVFGGDGCLKLWNPKFGQLWGVQPEKLEGSPHITNLVDLFAQNFADENWDEYKDIIVKNGLEREARRGRITRGDNTVLEYTVIPLPDGNILNGYFDITDEAQVENALMEKNAALEETERMKMDFLANVSYQLRTPLNAITGFAEILDQKYFGDLNERQQEYTQGMVTACARLADLIDDILDLSTIEAGYLELSCSDFSVYTLMDEINSMAEEWGRKNNIHITLKCPKNIGQIHADPLRVKQIVMKLISNAITFSPDGGKMEITAKRSTKNKTLTLTVKDTGVGIDKEDLEKIFSPFEKAQFSKGRNTGAGLGLSIVKRIMDLHDGEVLIESELGKGTAVSCVFPLPEDKK